MDLQQSDILPRIGYVKGEKLLQNGKLHYKNNRQGKDRELRHDSEPYILVEKESSNEEEKIIYRVSEIKKQIKNDNYNLEMVENKILDNGNIDYGKHKDCETASVLILRERMNKDY